ncbi:SusC/RagA family TonB-linked outer membrane protein [Parasediminibacterium sp. JCM 36343]|uniref:SusC/RagA family TonB-linked outer membrane protein n=1 Tax=Parasediminibacterium sp. JCM 36343 TaxID=3374279 RepID=UPI00397E4033
MRIHKFYKQSFLSLLVLLGSAGVFAQNNNLSLNGRVEDAKYKTPLAGATIHIKGTTHEVITDLKGFFQFVTGQKVPVTYLVSFVGYQTQEVLVTEAKPVTIYLQEASGQLNDVVVVGYGTQKKKEVTGSVGSVSKDRFTQTTPSFDNLLQGAVAGVAVTQSSGQPGATASIRIRGGNSLSFGNDPLYVIDGFIYYNDNNLTNLAPASGTGVSGVSSNGLSTINPGDIESIDILKDAAATAIYGSRGANGVVIITTKKGTKGSNNISYSTSYGTQRQSKTLNVLNGPQWASLFDDLYKATPSIQTSAAASKKYIDSLGAAGVSQDWVGAAIKPSTVQNHQLNIYGGDDKSRYSLSGNYYSQDGLVLSTNFKRYSARFNYEKNFTSKLKLATNIFGSNSLENKTTGNAYNDINFSNAFSSLYIANPLQTAKNANGTYNTSLLGALNSTVNVINGQNNTDNLIQDIASTVNQTKLTRVLGNFSAEYKILDKLVWKSTFGVDILNTKLNYYAPSFTAAGNNTGTISGSGSIGTIAYLSWLNENTVNYDLNLGEKNSFNVLAGYTTQYQKSETGFLAGQSFPTDVLTYNNLYLATANKVSGSGEALQTRNSWLGRLSYSFDHKYNFSFSSRADGASPAGINKKWGFFPAVGFSWNASDENFLKQYKTISNLKVRLTAGSVGNANFPAYSSLETINVNGYYFGSPLAAVNGLSPTQLSNPDLGWETTTQYNAGIDLGLVKNRINVTADIYYKKTSNLYVSGGGLIPLTTGYATASENIGSLENKGFELSLNTENIKTKNFSWKSTIIYATNASKILSLGPSQSFQPTAPTGQVSPVIVKVGLPVGTFWGYSTDGLLTTEDVYGKKPAPKLSGVSQVTGDRKYLHANGLTGANITTADKHDLGNAQAKFTASLNNTITYKEFDVNFFFQGSFGNKIFNLLQQQLEKTTTMGNVTALALNRWDSIRNPHGTFQKVVNAPVMQVQDTYIEDGSYIRLKNITLGYNIPKGIAEKIRAKQIRIYASAQNLLTITKYAGQDPEANFYDQNSLQPGIDYGVYPRYKTYLVGVNVTF